jgi:small subunit ribosomal protein S2
MRPFIYGARNGIHIVDLDQTARLFKRAFDFVDRRRRPRRPRALRRHQAPGQDIVQEEAVALGMYFVTNRWLGGTLTNFRTIKQGLDRLRSSSA